MLDDTVDFIRFRCAYFSSVDGIDTLDEFGREVWRYLYLVMMRRLDT